MSRATIILLRKIPVSHGTHSRVCSDPSHYICITVLQQPSDNPSHEKVHYLLYSVPVIPSTSTAVSYPDPPFQRDPLNFTWTLRLRPLPNHGRVWVGDCVYRRETLVVTLRRKASRHGEPEPILGIARSLWPTHNVAVCPDQRRWKWARRDSFTLLWDARTRMGPLTPLGILVYKLGMSGSSLNAYIR